MLSISLSESQLLEQMGREEPEETKNSQTDIRRMFRRTIWIDRDAGVKKRTNELMKAIDGKGLYVSFILKKEKCKTYF
uniref:SPK domain-containing protein n=1 Tax=Caenorhabditis tropicalis TaxID=1561998 RepID=A0A1I7T433_9PELO